MSAYSSEPPKYTKAEEKLMIERANRALVDAKIKSEETRRRLMADHKDRNKDDE